jgi:hypothetical protein
LVRRGLDHFFILAACVVLAGALFALGIPSSIDAVHELAVDAQLDTFGNQTPEALAAAQLPPTISGIDTLPPASHTQVILALAQLDRLNSRAVSPTELDATAAATVQRMRRYLETTPADTRAWAALAQGLVLLHRPQAAAVALKMSILTGPWYTPLLVSRCALGIDLFSELDQEGRDLLKGQFRIATDRAVTQLANVVKARGAGNFALRMLGSSPEEATKLMRQLART